MVQVGILQKNFGGLIQDIQRSEGRMNGDGTDLLHHGQNPRLVVVVAVRTNAEIDLVLERVLLVCRGQFEDAECEHNTSACYPSEADWIHAPVGRSEGNLVPSFCFEMFTTSLVGDQVRCIPACTVPFVDIATLLREPAK